MEKYCLERDSGHIRNALLRSVENAELFPLSHFGMLNLGIDSVKPSVVLSCGLKAAAITHPPH